MGPVANRDLDQPAFLNALDSLARAQRLAMVEVEHPMLDDGHLELAGFVPVCGWTYLVALEPDRPDLMWRSLSAECRNRIRKAMRAGLTVEETNDPAIVDEYYDQYYALWGRRGLVPSFPIQHVRLLIEHVGTAGCLFALRVRDRSGRVLATGFFPHDDRTMYFWSGSSRQDSLSVCPNDYLHWSAMCIGASRGIGLYNMSGYGRFKKKFGGRLVGLKRWHKVYSWAARWARGGYEVWLEKRMRLEATCHRLAESVNRSPRQPERGPRDLDGTFTDAALSLKTSSGHVNARPKEERPTSWFRKRTRPPLPLSDLWHAPLHDFPIRDEALYQYLPLASDMDVLEIGPGSGITAFRLARQLRRLTLLDVAPANIARLRTTLGGDSSFRFICADICKPGLASLVGEQFDVVYGLEVFEFLPDPRMCLHNIGALLRPGGRLLLLFPNYPPPRSPGVTYFPNRSELDELLREAGFANWRVYAVRLRPHAHALYEYLHERPLRVYRELRSGGVPSRPQIYDETWTFRHRQRVEPFKVALHAGWRVLAAAMRLGGDCFERTPLENDILNRNLLLMAER
jgi:SAM-dependent methyltransferase